MAYRDQSAFTLLLYCPCFYFVCLYVYVCSHAGTCVYMETRNFSCHSSSGLSLAWPGMIPVLGGDWLAWLAREPQGLPAANPSAVLTLVCHIRLDVTSVRILGTELGSTCLCGKHFTDWAVSPPLFCSLNWVLGMLYRFFLKLQKLVSEKVSASLFYGLGKHYVTTPFCRRSIQ